MHGSTLLSSLKDGTLKTDLKDIGVKAVGKSSHFMKNVADNRPYHGFRRHLEG